jgi:hypothetical protein
MLDDILSKLNPTTIRSPSALLRSGKKSAGSATSRRPPRRAKADDAALLEFRSGKLTMMKAAE